MNNINDLVPTPNADEKRLAEPTGSISNYAISTGKVKDHSKERKLSKGFIDAFNKEIKRNPFKIKK